MKVSDIIRYLEVHRFGVSQQRGTVSPDAYLVIINEGIRKAAQVLMEAKAMWLQTVWLFDLVAQKNSYLLRGDIIGQQGTRLSSIDNFARIKSISLRTQGDDRWANVQVVDMDVALSQAAPDSSRVEIPTAYFEMVEAADDFEHDYRITFPNPPNYAVSDGVRLAFYAFPSPLPTGEDSDYEAALPAIADRFLKLACEAELYRSEGRKDALMDLMRKGGEYYTERQQLVENSSGPLTDRPTYVQGSDDGGDWLSIQGWGVL